MLLTLLFSLSLSFLLFFFLLCIQFILCLCALLTSTLQPYTRSIYIHRSEPHWYQYNFGWYLKCANRTNHMHTIHVHVHIAGEREKNLNHIQDNIHTNHHAMDMLRNRNEITTRTIQSNIKRWTDDAIHHLKSMYNRLIDIAIYMLSLFLQCRRNDIYVFMIMATKKCWKTI